MPEGVQYKLFLNKVPKDGKFARVHAVLLTNDGRTLLRYKEGTARNAGGKIEQGEDIMQALKRELMEELHCEINLCDYLGYVEATDNAKNVNENWARIVARISHILPPEPDPDRSGNWIYGRALAPYDIAREEMGKVPVFGDNNIKVLDAAYELARKNNYFTELPSQEYETLNVESRDAIV